MIDSRWFLYLMHPQFNTTRPLSDRVSELLEAIPLIVLLSPVLLLSALAVKLGDGGPVIYRQKRVGEGGREFDVLKLRTMTDLVRASRARSWSSADDPRVTPGRPRSSAACTSTSCRSSSTSSAAT